MASLVVNPRSSRIAATFALPVALAACGGKGPVDAGTGDAGALSASVTSSEAGRQLNCREEVHARVSVTNRGASAVMVTAVRKTHAVVSGGCGTVPVFTYQDASQLVAANSTSTVFDRALYSFGSGCCPNPSACSGTCEIQETFEVLTASGTVSAGRFSYTVSFSGCQACPASGVSGTTTCLPTSLGTDVRPGPGRTWTPAGGAQ